MNRAARLGALAIGVLALLGETPHACGQDPKPERVEVFVWDQGDDENDGSRSAPKKTLAAALEQVRGNGRPTLISIAPGQYRVTEPIQLGASDSRTEEAPLVIRGVGKRGPAIFTAGDPLPNDQWRKLQRDDRMAEFLPQASRRAVRVIDLADSPLEAHFAYRPDPEKRQSYAALGWSGYVLRQSRWPNNGYAYIDKVLDRGPSVRHLKANEKPTPYSYDDPTGGSFTTQDPLDLQRLADEFAATGDVQLEGYFHNDWFFQKEPLGRVDLDKQAIQLLRYTRYGIEQKIGLPRRFRLINTVSSLDQPGEWYFDHQQKRLYLWPVKRLAKGRSDVQIIGDRGILKATDVSHVRIERLVFEGFGDTGVNFQRGSHITIAGCEFRAASGQAARVQHGTHNTIRSCDAHDVVGGFVMSGVRGSRMTLTEEHNRMVNNHFWRIDSRGYGGGASVNGVGFYFAHNVMHDMQCGLTFNGNDLIAEYNEFYNLGYEMGDWNPCYSAMDFASQNNLLRFNLFHHLMETPKAYPITSIRADGSSPGLRMRSNIFYKTGRAAVAFGGPNCELTDNFVLKTPALLLSEQHPYKDISKEEYMQNKRDEYAKLQQEVESGARKPNDFDNPLDRAQAVFGAKGWETNEVWKKRYPNFANHFDFNDYDHSPWTQSFSVVKNNFIDEQGRPMAILMHGKKKAESLEDVRRLLPTTADFDLPIRFDPRRVFRSPGSLDFRFRKRLPEGMKPFDFEKVGLVKDPYRPETPDKNAYRRAMVRRYYPLASHRGEPDFRQINLRHQPPEYLKPSR